MINTFLKACAFSLALPLAASAVMRLDGDHVDVKPKPEDEVAEVTFSFKNDGDKPVRILNLESACSCLSATLDRAVYEPGTSGTGKAEFKVSTFVGKQEKAITVTTDDPKQPEWIVTFIMDVPAVVDIEPKMVQWWIGEKAEPKDVTVKMTGPDPMKIKNITSTRENVEYSFKEVKPGREFVITVKPKNTTDIMIGALKLETDSKIPKYQRQLTFFGVVRQPASRAGEVTAGAKPEVKVVEGQKPGSPNAAPPPVEEVKKPEPAKKTK
ncbi:MAG: papd-like [Verrucomicrobiaceae bacterium]|nr:papd-like [Verrucomicrobiaceae bacterium]